MNLESQCCSFELARKLKELGVKQKSLFCYTFENNLEFLPVEIRNSNMVIAAFTASELLEVLPKFIGEYFIVVLPDLRKYWSIEYVDSEYAPMGVYPYVYCTDKNLCNALAKILIFLIENKIIEVLK